MLLGHITELNIAQTDIKLANKITSRAFNEKKQPIN